MRFSCLASGSSGNCFYIENNDCAILVDAGISAKQILERVISIGENANKLRGIFISHEHIDHIRGADVLARKLKIPIFSSKGTLKNAFVCSEESLLNNLEVGTKFYFNGFEITPIAKSHDAKEPISFIVKAEKTLSVLTDIGFGCKNISEAISNSDALILESNHDLDMLKNGKYPFFLKKRILSNEGHLSNFNSGILVMEHGKPKLKNIVLAHLSKENNRPEIALSTFSELIEQRKDLCPNILISNDYCPTKIIKI